MYNFIKKITPKKIKQIIIYGKTAANVYGKFFARIILGEYKKERRVQYPTVIQMPITYKCNFDCVMCSMKKMILNTSFSAEELDIILSDKLYRKVTSVGINGGEPFLVKNLDEYVNVIVTELPKLKNLYIITNGYFTESIVNMSKKIYSICQKSGVNLTISVSMDGVGDMQDKMRGKKGAFEHACKTISELYHNKTKYCDIFQLACTLTKVNIYHIAELDSWAKGNGYPISYNVATIHKRLKNEDKYEEFSLYEDESARLMAAEFFYSKYKETYSETYFGLYYYIRYGERISLCKHQCEAVTLTPNAQLAYCATHSDEIGNVLEKSSYEVFFDKRNIEYREHMRKKYCEHCSQYSSALSPKAYLKYYARERMKDVQIY